MNDRVEVADDSLHEREWLRMMSHITELISDSLEIFLRVGERHGWRPRNGSEGAVERADEVFGEGVAITVHLGWTLMAAPAQEAMETLINLLNRYPPRSFSPHPVARMGIETLARAWWLYEPDIGPAERAARGLTEILSAMRSRAGLPGSDDSGLEEGLSRVAEMAEGLGLKTKEAADGRLSKVGEVHRPKSGVLIDKMYEVEGLGQWAYSDTSSIAHGNVIELFRRLSDGDDDDGDSQHVNVDEADIQILVLYALQAWWFADLRRVDYFGWRDPEWIASANAAKERMDAMVRPLTSG